MQQTHISQPSGSGTDKGTSFKPRVPDVPTDESEEELSWNFTDDEGDDNEQKDEDGDEEDEGDDDRGSKRRREGKEPESASALAETATRSAGRSSQGSISRQAFASESALAKEPMQITSQMEEPSHPKFDAGADDQPIVQSSQHPEWFHLQQKLPTPDRD
nr:hypothetical protein [Tanacetum cinerariifolium]